MRAASLSYGHQRLLEVAMGLALQPKLLILDEPTQGLSDGEIEQFCHLAKAVATEATILLIEPQVQDADMMMANPMNFQARKRILRYGYDSAARLLLEKFDAFAAACARHGIACTADRLTDRPWELME